MRTKILSDEEVKWARERYAEGYYQREIGDALFITQSAVFNYVKGVKRQQLPELVYDGSDKHNFITANYYAGYTQAEIAKVLGLQITKLNKYIKNHNIKKKPRGVLVYDFKNEQEKC